MSTLTHLPLEKYQERYTEFLSTWEQEAFLRRFPKLDPIEPDSEVHRISSGEVLDASTRTMWCLKQMRCLMSNPLHEIGKVYFSDFYTSGLDALAYSRRPFKAYSFCWAQSFDQYDFTVEMIEWMRPYEVMALSIYTKVFVAQSMLKELIVAALPSYADKIEVVGLPFNSTHVKTQLKSEDVPHEKFDCVYSSRWDKEKQPYRFLELVKANPDKQFAICTGSDELRGTDQVSIRLAYEHAEQGKNLTIFNKCTKSRYYGVLSRSEVQFNCALQDWVSYTLLEALTFGCKPLYPNFRGFPEVLQYSPINLYSPLWDVEEASTKLDYLIADPKSSVNSSIILNYHNESLKRITEIMYAT